MARIVIFDPGINDLEHLVRSFDNERYMVFVIRHEPDYVNSIVDHRPDCLIVYLEGSSSALPAHIGKLADIEELEDVPLIAIHSGQGEYNPREAVQLGVLQILSLPMEPHVLEANVAGLIQDRKILRRMRSMLRESEQQISSLQEDLRQGQRVQQSLLPPGRLNVDHFQLESMLLPSGQLCGDYQDYKLLSPTRLAVFQADVSGHGFASALIASRIKAYFDDNVDQLEDPAQFLAVLNRVLLNFGEHYQIATAVCVLIDLESRLVRLANAGHRTAYWFNRRTEECVETPSSGPALGMFEEYEIDCVDLPIDWTDNRLVIFTDGLIEFKQEDQLWVSEETFRDNILHHSLELTAEEYCRMLLDRSHALTLSGVWHDDVSLIVLDFC